VKQNCVFQVNLTNLIYLVLRIHSNNSILLLIILAIICNSCLKSKKPGIPNEIQDVLNQSGIHKPGLMRVILTFQKPEDSLKLKSAYYLIENLDNNYSIQQSLVDSLDNPIEINIYDFPNISSIKQKRDSIEKVVGRLNYKADSIWLDFKNISPDFLIKHIKKSYDIWNSSLFDNSYDFNTFCNYILPYRVSNEEIENYIDYFQDKYGHLLDGNKNQKEIAILLNDEINRSITYDERIVYNPNIQSIELTKENKSGDLRDINIYKIKALRSLGIAAAMDYTPFFADSIFGYYSTTVILPNKEKIYLKNSDDNRNPYHPKRTAKVYRRIHGNNPVGLFSIKEKSTHTPPFLGNYNYIDVSNEYIATKNITMQFVDTSQFVYLAVFNDNEWKPIEWALLTDDSTAIFTNMGIGVRYTPVKVSEEAVIPIGKEFILSY